MEKKFLVAKNSLAERIPTDPNPTKEMVTAREDLDARIMATRSGENITAEFNVLANEPYDIEIPMTPIISAIAHTANINKGDEYKKWTIGATGKTIYTVVDGSVTQTNFSPTSPSALTLSEYNSAEDYVYLGEILTSKYDSLALKLVDQMEAMDRLESKLTFDAIIAAAVSASNTFANASGASTMTFPKLVEMVRSMAKYGSKLVLISGSEVTTDLILMDYDVDKNREVNPGKAGISEWFKVEEYQYTHSGTQTVLATDKAILIATNDSKNNRPIHFVRRKVDTIDGASQKERVVITKGPAIHVGALPKLAYSTMVYESFGIVVVNTECCAVYKKASVYA